MMVNTFGFWKHTVTLTGAQIDPTGAAHHVGCTSSTIPSSTVAAGLRKLFHFHPESELQSLVSSMCDGPFHYNMCAVCSGRSYSPCAIHRQQQCQTAGQSSRCWKSSTLVWKGFMGTADGEGQIGDSQATAYSCELGWHWDKELGKTKAFLFDEWKWFN